MDDDMIYAIHKALHTALLVCVLGIMFGMALSVLVHVYTNHGGSLT